MKHLGAEVARAAGRHRVGGDEPREPQATKIEARRAGERPELTEVLREVAAEVLAVELVAAVHRDRHVVRVLHDLARLRLLFNARQAIHGDAARENEAHRAPEAPGLVLRHAKEVERALHVHLVGELRIALSAGGEQRRQVEHDLDLVVRRDLIEEVLVHDVARVRLQAKRTVPLGQRSEVDRDGAVATLGVELLEERPPDFAVGAGDEDDRLRHGGAR